MSDFMDYKRRHQLRKQRKLTMLRESPKDYSLHPKKSGSSMMNAPYWADLEEPQKPPVNHTRRFMLQCVVSALLVGAVYWVNTNDSQLSAVKHSIKTAMTQEFQFAAVSQWYENYLGDPISFLPNIPKDTKSADEGSSEHQTQTDKSSFANPVTGEVKTPYKSATKGVTVETHAHTTVKAVKDGLVVFVGKKKTIGETVVIQHKDNDESWYGKLDAADVKVYQEVKKGQNIGVTSGTNNKKGSFYFALKKGEKFIDPIQVMSFD
ncbi:M23 family metallopeptidase [Sporolactobacillus terrae]|uniref:M23 family metallopeptidase n=1 Tax=Sporolactobacillus terrae TaxID=269673 RepID=UPI00048DC244|nr:M23 family metallopeptidase [Sporolactobacillus terrae]